MAAGAQGEISPSALPHANEVLERGADFLKSFIADGPLLVALSGGSDSSALLHVFDRLCRTPAFRRFNLAAATIDHGLRSGSSEEARIAGETCARLGIPHRILRWEGAKPSSGLQAAARLERYRLLTAEAKRLGARAILVGHTADDQKETIAMRAGRGEGPGLAGMAPAVLLHETIWALRPFLCLSRQTLRDQLDRWGEVYMDDPSNANPRFERARLRLAGETGSAPALSPEERLGISVREAEWLKRHGRVMGGAVAFIEGEGLSPAARAGAALALFRLAAAIGGKVHLPGRSERERLDAFLAEGQPGRLTLGGTVFDRRREGLYLYREKRGLAAARVPVGSLHDGRYRLEGPEDGEGLVIPVEDSDGAKALLEGEGVPPAIARRAAPALFTLSGPSEGMFLRRVVAAQAGFLPGFDLPFAEALRSAFRLPPLPPLPVRQ